MFKFFFFPKSLTDGITIEIVIKANNGYLRKAV